MVGQSVVLFIKGYQQHVWQKMYLSGSPLFRMCGP